VRGEAVPPALRESVDLALQFGLAQMPNGYFTKPLGSGATESLRSLQVGLEVKDLFADAQRNWPARPRNIGMRLRTQAEEHDGYQSYRAAEPPIEFATGIRFRRP
jgi:hypothetical protein